MEVKLGEYLGVKHVSLFTNATVALITALQALRITGEVITTPYSFVATSHSLVWNGIKPVFVDIDPETLNINTEKIEAAITPQTTAIMPVHCYGQPCDVERIRKIADNYNLKIIYDAAHAFGVEDKFGSILNHGDLSVVSFHATKVFNTFEGGAIISSDAKTKSRVDHLKNFGFVDEVTVVAPGINGKMSEFNAALGLVQLNYVEEAIKQRKLIDSQYRLLLEDINGIKALKFQNKGKQNFAYFPIMVNSEYQLTRNQLYEFLKSKEVYSRRYFYPLISDFPMYRGYLSSKPENLSIAKNAAEKVLCLPIYPGLKSEQIENIAQLIRNA